MNLKDQHKKRFSAIISGLQVTGIISVQGNEVYLCQNELSASKDCRERFGHSYAWCVGSGSDSDLRKHLVKNLEINDLFDCHGREYTAKIKNMDVKGHITVDGPNIFLCQEFKDGDTCRERHGHKYSWNIAKGTPTDLARTEVENLFIIPIKQDLPKISKSRKILLLVK